MVVNCTDLIAAGLVLVVAGVWFGSAALFAVGVGVFGAGMWWAGRLVAEAQRGDDP